MRTEFLNFGINILFHGIISIAVYQNTKKNRCKKNASMKCTCRKPRFPDSITIVFPPKASHYSNNNQWLFRRTSSICLRIVFANKTFMLCCSQLHLKRCQPLPLLPKKWRMFTHKQLLQLQTLILQQILHVWSTSSN